MTDLVIVGQGGLAKEVAFLVDEINRARPAWHLRGFVVPRDGTLSPAPGKYGVCGTDDWLAAVEEGLAVAVANGAPAVLERLHTTFRGNPRLTFPNLVHPRAYGDWDRIRMGQGNIVLCGASFTTDIAVGSGNVFNPGCTVAHDCAVGDFNLINPGANISGGVVIGDRVVVGTGSQILQYLRVCSDVIVGAGAVVVRDITEPGTYVGVPARRLSEANA
jgi:sugar O-acyltransferase (sialic acid O-acetyltransferase NeuD family)